MFSKYFDVVPSNTDPQPACEAIYVGGAGNISITSRVPDGSNAGSTPGWTETTVILTGLTVGRLLPISPYRINATGTTATLLVGMR